MHFCVSKVHCEGLLGTDTNSPQLTAKAPVAFVLPHISGLNLLRTVRGGRRVYCWVWVCVCVWFGVDLREKAAH